MIILISKKLFNITHLILIITISFNVSKCSDKVKFNNEQAIDGSSNSESNFSKNDKYFLKFEKDQKLDNPAINDIEIEKNLTEIKAPSENSIDTDSQFHSAKTQKTSIEQETSVIDMLKKNAATNFSFTQGKNSNKMFSIWKIKSWISNYFYFGNSIDELNKFLSDTINIYCLFSEDKIYRFYQFDSQGIYYLNIDNIISYTYDSIKCEITSPGIKNGGFHLDGNNAVFSYFNSTDGKWNCQKLSKVDSINGKTLKVTNDEFIIKMWSHYLRNTLSLGDGSSTGAVDLTINYNGNKIINEQSPITALLRRADNNNVDTIAGNAIISKIKNKIRIAGIPDGIYYLFLIRVKNLLNNPDPEPGDVYSIYDGSYYGGPEPEFIYIEEGNTQDITVFFNDDHILPSDINGTAFCRLKSITESLNNNKITIAIEIDTDLFCSDPFISVYLHAPSTFKYGQARFDRGQIIELNLFRDGSSSSWIGSTEINNYNESGL